MSSSCPVFSKNEMKLILTMVKKSKTRKIDKKFKESMTKSNLGKQIKSRLKYIPSQPTRRRKSTLKTLNMPFLMVNSENNKFRMFRIKAKGKYRLLPKTKQLIFNKNQLKSSVNKNP